MRKIKMRIMLIADGINFCCNKSPNSKTVANIFTQKPVDLDNEEDATIVE